MPQFPTIHSILSPNHLANLVKGKYGFGEETSCKILKTGINHSYLISEGDKKYVFRVYSFDWRSILEIKEELSLLNLLKENSVSVSYPLPDKAENYIQEIEAPEGSRYAVLFSFAEGSKIRALTEEHCQNIGNIMARFHKVSSTISLDRMNYNAKTLTQLPYEYAKEHFAESLDEMKFMKISSERLTSVFKNPNTSKLRQGVVHPDMWYDNMNIDENGNITVFDFDFCGNGLLVLDLAYFAIQLFNTEPDKEKYESKLTSFYKGYEEVTPIPEEEKELLTDAALTVWVFYLGVQAKRFDDWSNLFFTENYLKHYIGLVRTWLAYNETNKK